MKTGPSSGINKRIGENLSSDGGEIISYPEAPVNKVILRESLSPAEVAVSLPPSASPESPIAVLTKFFGPVLTVANPAWGGEPIPRMRALQKKIIEYSLTQDEGDRKECMEAISLVERAVQLRLRYQQMHMSDEEMDIKPEDDEKAGGERS